MSNKWLFLRVSLLVILPIFSQAQKSEAQLFGLLHPAKPERQQSLMGGGYLLLVGGADVGFAGQLRYGAGQNFDLGGKLGFLTEGEGGLMLGGDLLGQIVHSGAKSPFNFSLDGSFEVFLEENVTILGISGTGIIDDVIKLENGKNLQPYGALALDIVNVDEGVVSDTDPEITLVGGIVYELSPQMDFLGEIQISSLSDAELGLNVGLNFR